MSILLSICSSETVCWTCSFRSSTKEMNSLHQKETGHSGKAESLEVVNQYVRKVLRNQPPILDEWFPIFECASGLKSAPIVTATSGGVVTTCTCL